MITCVTAESAAKVAVVMTGERGSDTTSCSSELLSSSSGTLKVPEGSLVIWGSADVSWQVLCSSGRLLSCCLSNWEALVVASLIFPCGTDNSGYCSSVIDISTSGTASMSSGGSFVYLLEQRLVAQLPQIFVAFFR